MAEALVHFTERKSLPNLTPYTNTESRQTKHSKCERRTGSYKKTFTEKISKQLT